MWQTTVNSVSRNEVEMELSQTMRSDFRSGGKIVDDYSGNFSELCLATSEYFNCECLYTGCN